jgi:hypothetical protein
MSDDELANFTVRVYIDNELASEQSLSMAFDDFPDWLKTLAEQHAELALMGLVMIEVENLDEPDPLRRFMRVGTDPRRMVAPVQLDFSKEKSN